MPTELVTGPTGDEPDVLELEFELWAQSAAGKKRRGRIVEKINRTIEEMNARKRCHWLVIPSSQAMKLEFSPYLTKIISLLDSIW
jgi:hypothetical protein